MTTSLREGPYTSDVRMLLVCPNLPPSMEACGDGTDRLAREYLARGDQILVLTDEKSERDRPYRAVSVGRAFNIQGARRALEYALNFNPEAALVQYTPFLYSPRSAFPMLVARGLRQAGIPTSIFAHECFYPSDSIAVRSALKGRYLRLRDSMVLGAADAIFVPNEEKRTRVLAHMPSASVWVLPVAANVEPVEIAPRRAPAPTFRLLAFGVVMPRRRLELLIEAVALLAQRDIDVTLTIAGRIWDESYAAACERQCGRHGISDRVTMTGALSNERLSAAFGNHDLFLHAAEEGAVSSAGSLLAALAHGIPVVAVRTERDDACFAKGITFVDASAENIGRACASLLRDPNRLEQCAIAARRLYDNDFGWRRIVNTIDAALLGPQRRAAV